MDNENYTNPQHFKKEDDSNKPKANKPHNTHKKKGKVKINPVKRTLTVIGTTLLSLVLVAVITGSIVAAAFTVYVVQFMEDTNVSINIDINDMDMDYTTFIYGYDKDGTKIELASISRNANRIPVKLEDIPKHVQYAFVYTEDERFYEHDGVDWKRTFTSFLNEILNIFGRRQGGSTITQQLVKNITRYDDPTWERKMTEITQASAIEKCHSKDAILESYLNIIGFGGSAAGIQAASHKYFGKDVSELSIAEGACLAAIPKDPENINPFADKEANLARQKVVLSLMYKNGSISQEEYEDALAEEIHFVDPNAETEDKDTSGIQNWFIDTVIDEVTRDFMETYGLTYQEASDKLYNGGYEIYSTVDIEMQKEVEAKFKDYTNFSSEVLQDPPQAAFICYDYNGNILAVVGGIGEKPGSNVYNRATMATRSPGSCIKPITSYSYGLENNYFHWSTIFENSPIEIKDEENPGSTRKWPYNYNSKTWDYGNYFTFQALQRSLNTIPAQLIQEETPQAVFNYLQNKFQVSSLSIYDADLSPLAVGALTNGISLKELVASYQVFGNAGKLYAPTSYTQVIAQDGSVVLQHNYTPIQSISEDTAYIMNKLMQQVIEGPNGTGKAAKLETTPLIGKTGTSQDWCDLLFVGCTPDYVSGIWYGYDEPKQIPTGTYYSSSQVWKNVFGDIAEKNHTKQFPECDSVVELPYCTETGLIANETCPTSDIGYYKADFIPETCNINHTQAKKTTTKKTTTKKTTTTATTTETTTAITIDDIADDLMNN